MDDLSMTAPVWEGERSLFAKAFVAAQKATEAVKKAASNPAFKSKYADLASCVEAVVPALNANGIGVLQFPTYDGERASVTTTLLHESGASVSTTLHLRPTKPDPQGVGSAITYGRRYSLLAITGAAPEDDDGNSASAPGEGGKPFDRGGRAAFVTAATSAIDALQTEAACAKWYGDNVSVLKSAAPEDRNAIMGHLKERKAAIIERKNPDDPIPFGDDFPADRTNGAPHA